MPYSEDSPPDIESVKWAVEFLNRLPKEIPLPDFGFDPDGEMSIDWDFDARQVFSISFNKDGWINYAGLVGYSTNHAKIMGKDIKDYDLDTILDALRHVLNNKKY